LEGHILEHPDVADCAVIGIPDAYSGDIPMAFVTLNAVAAKKVSGNNAEVEKIKSSIKKVRKMVLELFPSALSLVILACCRP
jgi:4-coumarate--CoA ligase